MLAKYIALALAAAGMASAAAFPATTTKCAAQAILDKCLLDLGNITAQCGAQEYSCLCEAHKNMLTCYNNCPNDPNREIEKSQVTAYCVAAGGDSTPTTVAAPTTTSQSVVTTTATDEESAPTETATGGGAEESQTATHTGSSTATKTSSTATPSASGNAGSAVRPMGFVAGAVAAAAWFL